MSLLRDLAWQNIDVVNRSSVAHQLARYALGVGFEMLPQDVVHQAKRSLLDTLGCIIGALALKPHEVPGRPMIEAVIKDLGGTEESTVFGSGLLTTAPNATLVNSFLERFLDFNDQGHEGNHNSDGIPAIMAVCEREKSTGRDLLTSLVISYELGERIRESYSGKGGWTIDLRAGLMMPPALGKLMGLTEDQIANATGCCAGGSLPLEIFDPDKEEHTMRKNLRFGWVAHDAIMSCLLARRGFTGPVRVVEGDNGWQEVVLRGIEMDLEHLTDFAGWRTLNTKHKYFCAGTKCHGTTQATLSIVNEHDLKPEDIAAVRLTCRKRVHTNVKYPRNAESADHMPIYANAYAIKYRALGIDSIRPERFTDPIIAELIEKITVDVDPNVGRFGGKSEIITKDGRRFGPVHVPAPHGFGDDPLTDKELEDKFSSMAENYMPGKQVKQIFETVWNVEKLKDIKKLTGLMIVHSR